MPAQASAAGGCCGESCSGCDSIGESTTTNTLASCRCTCSARNRRTAASSAAAATDPAACCASCPAALSSPPAAAVSPGSAAAATAAASSLSAATGGSAPSASLPCAVLQSPAAAAAAAWPAGPQPAPASKWQGAAAVTLQQQSATRRGAGRLLSRFHQRPPNRRSASQCRPPTRRPTVLSDCGRGTEQAVEVGGRRESSRRRMLEG